MKKLLIAAVVGVLGTFVLATPAAAVEAIDDCKTVVTNLVDRPDSGTNGNWAKDTFTRTVKICHVEVQVEVKSLVPVASWHYTAKVTDTGTFMTIGGPNLSPGANHYLLADVPGTFEGGFTATFEAPANWQFFNNKHQGKTYTGAVGGDNPSSSDWVKTLWDSGFVGSSLNEDWKWTYTTCNEKWVNAAAGNSGDITGKSWKACHAVEFKNNCDTVTVKLKNNAPWPWAKGLFKLGDKTYWINGGDSKTIMVSKGVVKVYVWVDKQWQLLDTHTWTQPESCIPPASPSPSDSVSPSPSPSGSTGAPFLPVDNSLPVTGSRVALIGGAGTIAVVIGGIAYFLARKRRDETEFVAE